MLLYYQYIININKIIIINIITCVISINHNVLIKYFMLIIGIKNRNQYIYKKIIN